MVFGIIADALKSRREGKKLIHVVSSGNRMVSGNLPFSFKIIFWLTNLPYVLLTASVAFGPLPLQAVGPRWAHASALAFLTAASIAFHSFQIFGGDSVLLILFLAIDTASAITYGLTLGFCTSIGRAVRLFLLPIALLLTSGRLKRHGRVSLFAVTHGMWHLASAAVLSHLLYFAGGTSDDAQQQLAAILLLGWG